RPLPSLPAGAVPPLMKGGVVPAGRPPPEGSGHAHRHHPGGRGHRLPPLRALSGGPARGRLRRPPHHRGPRPPPAPAAPAAAPPPRQVPSSLVPPDISPPLELAGPADYVLHFASPASPVDYLRYPIQTLKVGSLGTHNTLGLAKLKGARYLLASTSEVY